MGKILAFLLSLLGIASLGQPVSAGEVSDPAFYEHLAPLDAERLAEAGMKDAYEELAPEFKRIGVTPQPMAERIEADGDRYLISIGGKWYIVYDSEDLSDDRIAWLWAKATAVFFTAINEQLDGSNYRLYAVNAGNDLFGVFLTESEWATARRSLGHPSDWPYVPSSEGPWFGQFH